MLSTTPLRSKIFSQTRSSSLPPRSHPLIPQFSLHLQKLHHHHQSSPLSLLSLSKNISSLHHLHNLLDDLFLLHHTQQVFARESREKWVDEVLEGYLGLVDACSTAKEFVFQTKEHIVELLSVIRRRRDCSDEIFTFSNSRKATQKMIQKFLKSVVGLKSRVSVMGLEKDQETIAVISMLKEAEFVTMEFIESLLVSVCGTKGSSRWGVVSRMIGLRRVLGHDGVEFEEIDGLLCKIGVGFRTRCDDVGVQIDELQQLLRSVEESLSVLEEETDSLFKRLVRTRVSLLNMHSQ